MPPGTTPVELQPGRGSITGLEGESLQLMPSGEVAAPTIVEVVLRPAYHIIYIGPWSSTRGAHTPLEFQFPGPPLESTGLDCLVHRTPSRETAYPIW